MAKRTLSNIAKHIHKGAFRAKAKAHGESTSEYAHEVERPGSKASTKTKRQAALAITFAKHRPK